MKRKLWRGERGQSLVEVAVFLPVALIIIAGLVELSLYLVTQNKVNTAAREAARFGANGGENAGMVSVSLSTVTQTLQLEIDRWDLWTVRGKVRARCLNGAGGTVTLDFGDNNQDFVVEHSYGISETVAFPETSTYVNSGQFREDVLQELSLGGVGTCAVPSNPAPDINGLQFVGMFAAHDVDSILGLDVFLESVFTVRALHVFRVTSVVSNNQTDGCDAFPLALHDELRSVAPNGNPSLDYSLALNTNSNQRYPSTLPTYAQLVQNGHVQDHSLKNQAQEGDVFLFVGEGSNNFNYTWLQWNTDSTCQGCNQGHVKLINSFTWPGNSLDPALGFHDVRDWNDTSLNIGDWVAISEAEGSAVTGETSGHIDRNRTLRVLLWHETGTLQGGGPGNSDVDWIEVAQFVNIRVLGYKFVGEVWERWLLIQFISYDNSCGQVPAIP